MKNFLFRSPNAFKFGNGLIEELGKEFDKLGVDRVLIVTDKVIVEIGLIDQVQAILSESGIESFVFDAVHPEPPVEDAYTAYDIYKENDCNGVFGIGGGSPLDVAKIVAMFATNPGRYEDYMGIDKVPYKGAPLILTPTTAGTGSEVSMFSIMIVDGSKAGVVDGNIIADLALVDPLLTKTVPRKVTAATGLDTLCHHIESYISLNDSPICDALCLEGIRVVGEYLRKAVGNGDDGEARYWMAYASTLGGYVMNLTEGAAANHGLAFAVGAKHNVGHGLSNALMLPYVLPLVGIAELDKVRNIGEALGLDLSMYSDREALDMTVATITSLVEDVGCYIPLREFGVTEDNIEALTDEVIATQGRVMGHSTYRLEREEITAIFRSAL